jgi:hypothetical protein
MWFKRHHRSLDTETISGVAQVGEQSLMTKMHPIKVTYRQCTSGTGGCIRKSAKYLHCVQKTAAKR